MKLVLLCAGRGTRLGSNSTQLPKPLTHASGGKSIVDLTLTSFFATGRIDEAVLVIGYRQEVFRDHAFDVPDEAALTLVPNEDFAIKGPAFSLRRGFEGLSGDAVVFGNGDTIVNPEAAQRIVDVSEREGIWLAVSRRERIAKDDLLTRIDEDGRVWSAEKATQASPRAAFVSAGVMLAAGAPALARLRSTIEARCRKIDDEQILDGPWHAIVRDLSKAGEAVRALAIDPGSWAEVDTRRDLQRARRILV